MLLKNITINLKFAKLSKFCYALAYVLTYFVFLLTNFNKVIIEITKKKQTTVYNKKGLSKILNPSYEFLFCRNTRTDSLQKKDETKKKGHKRITPYFKDNPIKKGIENFFPISAINKVIEYKKYC